MKDKSNKKPHKWTAAEKLGVVQESSQLGDEELGIFLRRKGLHATQLKEWTKIVKDAALASLTPPKRSRCASRKPCAPSPAPV